MRFPSVLKPVIPDILTGNSPLVLLCEHASRHVPIELQGLGLEQRHLDDHIGHDIGAEAVTRQLAKALDSTAVLATVSRLVCDFNRNPDTQEPFPPVSDHVPIPGNQNMPPAHRQARLDAYFDPFHGICDKVVTQAQARHGQPIILSIHSFTPVMDGSKRPWDIGFLYDGDDRLFRAFRGALSDAHPDYLIGDNEPYNGPELYYSMNRHGQARGLLNVVVELRQDLIGDERGQMVWARILHGALQAMALHAHLDEGR